MRTQIKEFGLIDIIKNTSIPGWILLSRPVLYSLFSRRRDLNSYDVVDISAIIFIIYAIVAFIAGAYYIYKSKSRFGINILKKSPILLFIIYSILGIVSMLWSVTPSLTGFRAFECIATALLIISVIQNLFETADLKYVILWSLLYCTWDIIWSLIRASAWAPDIFTYLESSQMMATSFFFMALYFVPHRWYNYLIMIMAIFSMSTVAYIGMSLGAISAFWIKGKKKIIPIIIGYVIFIAILAVGPYKFFKETIFFDKKDISLEETSGRDHLLDFTIDTIDKYPYGLGFFAAEPYVLYKHNFGAISAHNSLFSAGMGMGIPGIIVISVFFIAMGVITFSKYIPKNYKTITIGCFFVAFMHCMGNPSVGTRVYGAWIPCMYIFVLIAAMYIFGKHYKIEN